MRKFCSATVAATLMQSSALLRRLRVAYGGKPAGVKQPRASDDQYHLVYWSALGRGCRGIGSWPREQNGAPCCTASTTTPRAPRAPLPPQGPTTST